MKFDYAIIDGDPLVYRCGFAVERIDRDTEVLKVEPIQNALYNINSMVKKIMNRTGANLYKMYLTSSDKSNFRFTVDSNYKSNRKDARKPIYYKELRGYLEKKYGAQVIFNQEADDECSIQQIQLNNLGFDKEVLNSVVCSFDKDFNNIPGWHYNYIKDELYYVDEVQALRNFYMQILTGDNSDGILRIKKGWLKKKTEELINKALTEQEMYIIIFKEAKKQLETLSEIEIENELIKRGQLVWLRRETNEFWRPKNPKILETCPT